MTTKPRVKKYRIRRTTQEGAPATPQRPPLPAGTPTTPLQQPSPKDARAAQAQPEARARSAGQLPPQAGGQPASRPATDYMHDAAASLHPGTQRRSQQGVQNSDKMGVDQQIDAIRREGLTGRQLRMARRMAQKHGLPATSDFEAVRLLREKGIEPFRRSNMLDLVVPDGESAGSAGQEKSKVQLPQTVQPTRNLPSTEQVSPSERRIREVSEIQRDIARRRRRRMSLLLTRLAFFVFLPTLVAGWYYYTMATPMYSTKSEFNIINNDGGAAASGLAGLGGAVKTTQDGVSVQSFLTSKDAMLRLDSELGFSSHFSQDWIDPIQRLTEDSSIEQAFKTYSRNVKVGFDMTEGILKLEVTAADPDVSAEFSRRLIRYAEDRVDSLSRRKRDETVADAEKAVATAQGNRRKAQEYLVELQTRNQLIDPVARIGSITGQIDQLELQKLERELELGSLLDNQRPNRAKVESARASIQRIDDKLEELNAKMIEPAYAGKTLAELAAEIELARADVATADLMLTAALESLQSARQSAQAQVRYLTTSVSPIVSEDPAYPRKFENTLLAFFVFSGIYLLISLTASILREQVSS